MLRSGGAYRVLKGQRGSLDFGISMAVCIRRSGFMLTHDFFSARVPSLVFLSGLQGFGTLVREATGEFETSEGQR